MAAQEKFKCTSRFRLILKSNFRPLQIGHYRYKLTQKNSSNLVLKFLHLKAKSEYEKKIQLQFLTMKSGRVKINLLTLSNADVSCKSFWPWPSRTTFSCKKILCHSQRIDLENLVQSNRKGTFPFVTLSIYSLFRTAFWVALRLWNNS